MSAYECLLNNIPDKVDNIVGDYEPIRDAPLHLYTDIESCEIPFFAEVSFDLQVSNSIEDSIKTKISLSFNKRYDNVNFKVLAIDWTANDVIEKFNNKSIEFYAKPDNFNIYGIEISCTIYSTDFDNVYVDEFNSCFGVATVNLGFLATFSCGNHTNDDDLNCVCIKPEPPCGIGGGTISIILP